MKILKYSKHALVRIQKRGISKTAISIILEYGHAEHTRGGAKTWSMSKDEKLFAKADLGQKFINVERQLGYLVVSNEQRELITVAHGTRRFRKKY